MFLWLWAWNLVLGKEYDGKTYLIEEIEQQYEALIHRSFRYFHITFPSSIQLILISDLLHPW